MTVRSEEKGKRILDAHPNTPKEKLSFFIVADVAQDGAFDEVNEQAITRWMTGLTISNIGCEIGPSF